MKLDIKADIRNYAALDAGVVDVLNELRNEVRAVHRKVDYIMQAVDEMPRSDDPHGPTNE